MDPQAHGYIIVAFHPESKGIIIYLCPKRQQRKSIVLNINHDIVPQVIGNTLIGVSTDKGVTPDLQKDINRAIIYMPGSSHTYIQQNEQYITAHIM